ncbi:STT3 domain-containing protein [Pseudodesulfovibrio tunisiensis]|uniref:STT3 domain-containing protein n=1 Tax=Pseudodesulfovibrio tunisiensis TaxID=463192 RepID=UPI001FB37AA7|nr:STT3 domain-containing protein [Pseudodesulfovibrio tunisiensis]
MARKEIRFFCLVLALALCYQCFLYWPSTSAYLATPEAHWQGQPLLTTPDGYLFLRHAQAYVSGIFSPDDFLRPYAASAQLPLISSLAGHLSQWSNIPLESTAFYLPPILAALMVFVCLGMGIILGSWRLGLLTFCFAAASPMWFYRTYPGNFDTDGLNQVLFWSGLVWGYLMLRGSKAQRGACLALWIVTNVLLIAWWPQAGLPFALLNACFVFTGLALEKGWLRHRAFWLAAAIGTGLGATALSFPHVLPNPIDTGLIHFIQHIKLILGSSQHTFLAAGKSVSELGTLSFFDAIKETSGSMLLFVAAIGGGIHAWRHSRASRYYLLPGLFFFLVSFAGGSRFLMFCAPAVGLGGAWLLIRTLPQAYVEKEDAKILTTILGGLLLIQIAIPLVQYEINNTNDAWTAGLAEAYKRRSPEEAQTWNWWGPGYFLQHFANRKTFIDGGSQTNERAFIAAVPYAASSPELARNWIKFFTRHPNGISNVTHLLKDRNRAVEFLISALRQPYRLDDFIHEFNAPRNVDWKSYLFPESTAYLVALNSMLYHGTWLPMGKWTPKNPTSYETTTFAYQRALINRDTGTIQLPEKTVRYSRLYFITPTTLSHDPSHQQGPAAILMQGVPFVFMIPQKYFNVLAFRLLFISPDSVPGFTPIAYHPYVGGVWRVE